MVMVIYIYHLKVIKMYYKAIHQPIVIKMYNKNIYFEQEFNLLVM